MSGMNMIDQVRSFWNAHPCGSRLSAEPDRRRYFEEIAAKRYASEWHIPIVADFGAFAGRDVLEIGCGVGTDGLQFARHGARYVGVDLTPAAVALAQEHFGHMGAPGEFHVVNAEALPFADACFDHVYSFGVIHHSPNTEAIVAEIHRVLRPGGTFCVMVYNRSSINYHLEIMMLRRLFRLLLYPAAMPGLLSRLTGFDVDKLREHRRRLLQERAFDRDRWVSMNTDGPECPLAKVYSAREALTLFGAFERVSTDVWYFDRSHWPGIGRRLPASLVKSLGARWGWHRIVRGRKLSC